MAISYYFQLFFSIVYLCAAVRHLDLVVYGPASVCCPLVVVVVVSHIQHIGCQPEKTTLHGGQSRSWSAEQGKKEKEKVWQRSPPPPPRAACSEKK